MKEGSPIRHDRLIPTPFDPVKAGLQSDHPYVMALTSFKKQVMTSEMLTRHKGNLRAQYDENNIHHVRIVHNLRNTPVDSEQKTHLTVLFPDDSLLYFSRPLCRLLQRLSITSVEDLAQVTPLELMIQRNMGSTKLDFVILLQRVAREYLKLPINTS